MYSHALVHLD
jgi:hypothetical protein